MKWIGIVISIIFIVSAIFYNQINNIEKKIFKSNKTKFYKFENEKVDKIVTIILRIFIFIIGILSLISDLNYYFK